VACGVTAVSFTRREPPRKRLRAVRILHVVTRFAAGGSERNVAQLIAWQIEDGHQVDLALGAGPDVVALPPSVRLIVLPALVREVRPHLDLAAVRGLRAISREGRYDVVHTHQSKAGIIGRLAAGGTGPFILHTVHATSFGRDHSRGVSEALRRMEAYCATRTDVMICVGDELRLAFLRNGVGVPRQYRVIRSPLQVDLFAQARLTTADQRKAILADLRIPDDRPILLTAGALEPRKRTAMLVKLLQPMLSARRVQLVIAGEGPERTAIEGIVASAKLDGVHLVGHVTNMPQLLAASRVLVHTSQAEGVSQVVIQALLAGVPVVATRVTGLHEVANAPIVEVPVSGRGFSTAVEEALSAPVRHVPLQAFESWRLANVRHEYERLLEDLMSSHPKATRSRRGLDGPL
jgi:glycosyltransferase involved in cell wall biosynthesis